jgi:hypothetical protein
MFIFRSDLKLVKTKVTLSIGESNENNALSYKYLWTPNCSELLQNILSKGAIKWANDDQQPQRMTPNHTHENKPKQTLVNLHSNILSITHFF